MRNRILLIGGICLFVQNCSYHPEENKDFQHADSLAVRLQSTELKQINDLLREQPSDPDLYFQRGVIYRKLFMWKESEKDLQRAIRMDSTRVAFYMELADLYFASNQTRKSKETLEKITLKFPKHTDAYLKLAELYYFVKQYKAATEEINKALRLESDRADAYFLRGNIYREWGDTLRAISSLQTATELDPENNDAWYDLGLMYFFRNNPLSVSAFEKALSLKRSTRNYYGLAQALQKNAKYETALQYYDTILRKDSTDLKAWFSKGAILADVRGNYLQAEKIFIRIVRMDSTNLSARMALAWCMENTGRTSESVKEYKKILTLHPNYEAAVEALNRLEGQSGIRKSKK